MLDLLQYQFAQHACIAGVLVSIACGIIGTYIVSKRMVFLGSGISHAAFGGVGLGVFLGLDPLIVAIPFAIAAAIAMGAVQKKARISEDASIGILWAVSMAIGILFIRLKQGYAVDLFSYLFGNILTVSTSDLWLMGALNVIILTTVFLLYRELRAVTFDEEFAGIVGVPTRFVYFVLLALVALSVVILIRIVGVTLVIAFLAIPATVARSFTHDMRWMMLLASFVGLIASGAGFFLSYHLDVPSGSLIVLTLGSLFLVNMWIRRIRA